MARSCGIRIGPSRYELVVLDGSPRKHKIVAYASGEFGASEDGESNDASEVLRAAIQDNEVPTENIGIAVDTGLAAFRTLKLPFDDKAKIEQILKFEVESQLPQWNIDDVIVDYHVMESSKESSELLVTGIPKSDLAPVLETCSKAGFEPLEAELETTAMVNAACGADICQLDDAQILVHIGEESTSVVVMDGGKVREMRAIHIGAAGHEAPRPVDSEPAEAAEPTLDEDGQPIESEVKNLEDEDFEVDPIEAQRRLEQAIKRIRRELGRTVSAARTVNTIDAIYICGRELPGLVGSSILDVPVHVLDVFDPAAGHPTDETGELVVAYGAAIGQLGGGIMKGSLRREELKYTGAFEKVELPLAVACLLLVTLLSVQNIFTFKRMKAIDNRMFEWVLSSNNYLMGDMARGIPGTLTDPSDPVKNYVAKTNIPPGHENYPGDPDRTEYEQLRRIETILKQEIVGMEKDLGRDTEIPQPQSALHALTMVLSELESLKKSGARPSLRGVSSTYQQGRSGNPDSVLVKLDVTFFAESAFVGTQHWETFKANLTDRPWSETPTARRTDPIEDGKGIYVGDLTVKIDLSKLVKPATGEGDKS